MSMPPDPALIRQLADEAARAAHRSGGSYQAAAIRTVLYSRGWQETPRSWLPAAGRPVGVWPLRRDAAGALRSHGHAEAAALLEAVLHELDVPR